jgi:hypothetical protein
MGKILTSVLTIVLTLVMMGIGTYGYVTTPKLHIDTTSPLEITKQKVPQSIASVNSSNHQLFNDTTIKSPENLNENNLSIQNFEK